MRFSVHFLQSLRMSPADRDGTPLIAEGARKAETDTARAPRDHEGPHYASPPDGMRYRSRVIHAPRNGRACRYVGKGRGASRRACRPRLPGAAYFSGDESGLSVVSAPAFGVVNSVLATSLSFRMACSEKRPTIAPTAAKPIGFNPSP
jgi:hypothetical protein